MLDISPQSQIPNPSLMLGTYQSATFGILGGIPQFELLQSSIESDFESSVHYWPDRKFIRQETFPSHRHVKTFRHFSDPI